MLHINTYQSVAFDRFRFLKALSSLADLGAPVPLVALRVGLVQARVAPARVRVLQPQL